MRPLPEHRLSWLSTTLFALVVFVFFRGLFAPFVDTFLHAAFQSGMEDQHARQHSGEVLAAVEYFPDSDLVREVARCFGAFAAFVGAWAWRSPSGRRFHITFLSGLGLLIVTFAYVYRGMFATAVFSFSGFGSGDAEWQSQIQFISIPFVALISTATGLVLILTAINLDRRS